MGLTPEELRLAAFITAAAYAAMATGGFYPSLRARKRAARPLRGAQRVPWPIEAMWAGVQVVMIAGVSAAFFFPALFLSMPTSVLAYSHPLVAMAGASVFVAGAAYAGAAARHLGAQLAVAIETREGGKLVMSGPYARVRHPIYTGIFAMVGGLSLTLASPLLAAWLPVAVLCASVRARLEEELLAADPVFAPDYEAYRSRTGRFLPRRRVR